MSRQRKLEVIQQAEDVTIGELVRLTDVRYSTLKYYTEEGMLPFQQAEENLTRRYKREASIRRIRRIKALRAEGSPSPDQGPSPGGGCRPAPGRPPGVTRTPAARRCFRPAAGGFCRGPQVGLGLSSAGGSVKTGAGPDLRWVPRPVPGGDPGFLRESPDAKSRGGCPPAPLF